MARVAILHYTLAPAIGGIESLIDEQCAALKDLGHDVVLIAANGTAPPGARLHIIERMSPAHRESKGATAHARKGDLASAETLANVLENEIAAVLESCDVCWVHNILTVAFHPALATAVKRLARVRTEIRWTAWCEDLSAMSAYWDGPIDRETGIPGVRYIAISSVGARELSRALALPLSSTRVISPPVGVLGHSHISDQTGFIVRKTGLLDAQPTVLVPAKLLPHKRINVAIRTVAHLVRSRLNPLLLVTAAPSPHEPALSAEVADSLHTLTASLGVGDHVHFLTEILGVPPDSRTVRELMQLCDMVFLPSAEEGFGMPLREAAAYRVPIVCSDLTTFRETAPCARFVPLDAGAEEVAEALWETSELAVNRARREAIQSQDRFRTQVGELMAEDG